MINLWEIENGLFESGIKTICGVDEAGRGPLAGPVCAAAVILQPNIQIPGLNDSKKLTPKKRELLYDVIRENSLAYGVAYGSVQEIDELNILNATYLAMNRAIEKLQITPDITLIDGNRSTGITHPNICVVKGDQKSASIAAASILAKVTRDRLMVSLSEEYPEYAFEKHKGYPTALHYERISRHGISRVHRRSFLKKLVSAQ